MDTNHNLAADAPHYDRDLYAWCEEQAARLRERSVPGANDGLDYENLAEEIESLGKSQRREIRSRLRVLLAHLLSWRHQPGQRSNSWRATINEQRNEIELVLQDSPSLARLVGGEIATAYPRAVNDASSDTGFAAATFPATCPFREEQVLDHEFLPNDLDGAAAP